MHDDVRELKCPVNGILCSCYSGVLLFMALGIPCAGLIGAATFLYALTGQYAFCTCKLSMINVPIFLYLTRGQRTHLATQYYADNGL